MSEVDTLLVFVMDDSCSEMFVVLLLVTEVAMMDRGFSHAFRGGAEYDPSDKSDRSLRSDCV